MLSSASSRVVFCSGYHPAAGQLSASCRVTNEWNEQYKLSNSTGYLLRPEKFYKVTCYPAAF